MDTTLSGCGSSLSRVWGPFRVVPSGFQAVLGSFRVVPSGSE
jgi:hypothetical protein